MRVVFISPSGTLGGAEQVLLSALAAIRRVDGQVVPHLIGLADGPLLEAVRSLGIDVTLVPLPDALAKLGDSAFSETSSIHRKIQFSASLARASFSTVGFACRLRTTLRRLRPHVIHSNGFKAHLLAAHLAPRGSAVVWHLHDFCRSRPLMAKALRWSSGRAAAAVAVSQGVANDAARILWHTPISVVHNAIDLSRFTPGDGQGRRLDTLAGWDVADGDCLRVGMVATYARWKGHETFLQAAAEVVARQPHRKIRFYVIGGPIYQTRGSQWSRQELEGIAERLGLQGRVGFIDFQSNVADVYRSLDMLVHASDQPEPFGLTIVEGMACERAVIASRASGAAELFTPGQDALVFTPRDSAGLAQAIERLAGQPGLRRALGERGGAVVREKCHADRMAAELLACHRRATGLPAHGIGEATTSSTRPSDGRTIRPAA